MWSAFRAVCGLKMAGHALFLLTGLKLGPRFNLFLLIGIFISELKTFGRMVNNTHLEIGTVKNY